jgi:hypothetical protein
MPPSGTHKWEEEGTWWEGMLLRKVSVKGEEESSSLSCVCDCVNVCVNVSSIHPQ